MDIRKQDVFSLNLLYFGINNNLGGGKWKINLNRARFVEGNRKYVKGPSFQKDLNGRYIAIEIMFVFILVLWKQEKKP